MRLPSTVTNFLGCGPMRCGLVISDPFALRAAVLVGSERTAVNMNMVSASFFEDAGCRQLAVGIPAAHPQQCRAGLECRCEVIAVARGRVIVEHFLHRGTTETGAHQCRKR